MWGMLAHGLFNLHHVLSTVTPIHYNLNPEKYKESGTQFVSSVIPD